MLNERSKVLDESIRRLLRRNAIPHLRKIVEKTHAADLSRVFPKLTPPHQQKLFAQIDSVEKKGILFSELSVTDPETLVDFIQKLGVPETCEVLGAMQADDVADVIGYLPDDLADAVLKKMGRKGSEEVEDLLKYRDDSAGGIMIPNFIAFREDTTAHDAVASLQKEHLDVEMPFYLYVVDDYGKLVGVCSLRQLVSEPPDRPLKEFMNTELFSVRTDTDQEEVAKLVARYDILAVPVVDHANVLVGIVTVDDVIDIIREEATEDFLKMAGAGNGLVETQSVFKSMKIRLPWLFASCMGGIAAFFIIDQFEASLQALPYLAAFIPVIMGMGGNIGTQSSTIVVRGLSTGHLQVREIWRVVMKELSVGFLLGLVYGGLIGLVAHIQNNNFFLGVTVAGAVISSMSIAAFVGSMVPMIFARLDIDPAVATGPFVTTSIDILAVLIYFEISTILLGI